MSLVDAVIPEFQAGSLQKRIAERLKSPNFLKYSLPRLADRLRSYLLDGYYEEKWLVALRYGMGTHPSNRDRYVVMQTPSGTHNADPFLYQLNGRWYVFFERWTNEQLKGVICLSELLDDGTVTPPTVLIDRPYHVSYPFLIEYEGEIYLLPESNQNRTIELYRATDFPYKWSPAGVLMDGVCAVDTTIVRHQGKFWMFTSGLGKIYDSRFAEIFVFFADSLFGPWHGHPGNPVIRNPHKGRSAGALFFEDGQLIRPAQDCTRCYGYAVTLNRVEVLSEFRYRETQIGRILPDWMPGMLATHTFNSYGSLQALDGRVLVRRKPSTSNSADALRTKEEQ